VYWRIFFVLGIQSSPFAEFMGIILAIEQTKNASYRHLWLESDSILVLSIFSLIQLVPWFIRERWNICLSFCKEIDIKVSYICLADKLASSRLANSFEFS